MTQSQESSDVQFPTSAAIGRLAISSSGFVFDPLTGNSFTVNESGLAIMRAILSGATDKSAIVSFLETEFDATASVLGRDVVDFAARLREAIK